MLPIYSPLSQPKAMTDMYVVIQNEITKARRPQSAVQDFRKLISNIETLHSERQLSYLPNREVLTMLQTRHYRLLQPIELMKSIVGNVHYVSDNVVHCWGSGSSPREAIADYEANLIETYEDLSNGAQPLSRLAKDRLEGLRNYLSSE